MMLMAMLRLVGIRCHSAVRITHAVLGLRLRSVCVAMTAVRMVMMHRMQMTFRAAVARAAAPDAEAPHRIEGQVRGLSRMVEEDRYCIDIVTQIAAVRATLRLLEEEMLRDHVGHCVEHAIASGSKTEQRQ